MAIDSFPVGSPEHAPIPERDKFQLAHILEQAAIATRLEELKDIQRGTFHSDMVRLIRLSGATHVNQAGVAITRSNQRLFSYESQRAIVRTAVAEWNPYKRIKNIPPELSERIEQVRTLWLAKIEELLLDVHL